MITWLSQRKKYIYATITAENYFKLNIETTLCQIDSDRESTKAKKEELELLIPTSV